MIFSRRAKRLTEQSAISDTRRGLFVPDAVLTKKAISAPVSTGCRDCFFHKF
jgi:hypothetical protein